MSSYRALSPEVREAIDALAETNKKGRSTWSMVWTMIGGMASLATIHAFVVVPGILHAASVEAKGEIDKVQKEGVEERRRLVTRDELQLLSKELDRIHSQLDRIEGVLSSR